MAGIYLVRHGETQWNQQKRYQGQRDIPLDDVGFGQAERAAERLATSGASFVVSSDLSRALHTAVSIGDRLGLTVVTSTLWRERAYGGWEGLTRAEIQDLYPEEWRKVHANPHASGPRGGETLAELRSRAILALQWVLAKYPDQTGVVVTHGGLMRVLLAWIAGEEKPEFHLDNGGISLIANTNADLSVISINDTSHLIDI